MKTLPLLLLLAPLAPLLALLAACNRSGELPTDIPPGSSAHRGKNALYAYGCTACHTIPGIRAGRPNVGPSLEHIATRTYIAGVLRNTPENMTRWIQDPPAVDDKTAMPNLHVTESDARDIAAYLYTLQ